MKKLFIYITPFAIAAILSSCHTHKALLEAELSNTLSLERIDQPVLIDAENLAALKDKKFSITDKSGKKISYQWLTEGTSIPQKLLLLTNFGKSETKKVLFVAGAPSVDTPRAYGRYIPERYGDFAWENDKIAFRMYGKPLESNPKENAYGLDVWAKRTPNMVVNKWYKTGDYHHDHGEGLDFFTVGKTLGAGDILPFMGDSLNYLGNYTTSKILDSGALRISFELDYPEVDKAGIRIKAKKTITLDAGSHLNNETVTYDFSGVDSIPAFAGIVHWDEPKGTQYINPEKTFATYWEPAQGKDGSIATAIYFPPSKAGHITNTLQHLGSKIYLRNGEKYSYFNGGNWDRTGEMKTPEEWNNYIKAFAEKQHNPIKVTFKNTKSKQ